MLAGLGFDPFFAAGMCLLANTAPVAFGSIGIPIVTLANVTGLPVMALSAMVGRLCALISVIIPAYLVTVINWTMATPPIDLAKWPSIKAYYERTRARPSIARALAEEFSLYKAELARQKAAA